MVFDDDVLSYFRLTGVEQMQGIGKVHSPVFRRFDLPHPFSFAPCFSFHIRMLFVHDMSQLNCARPSALVLCCNTIPIPNRSQGMANDVSSILQFDAVFDVLSTRDSGHCR